MAKTIKPRKKIKHDDLIFKIIDANNIKVLKDLAWDAYKFGYLKKVEANGDVNLGGINYSINNDSNNKFMFRYYSPSEVIISLLNSKMEELKINKVIFNQTNENEVKIPIKSNFRVQTKESKDNSKIDRKISKLKTNRKSEKEKIKALTTVTKRAHETRKLDKIIDDLVHIATSYGYISVSENGFVLENDAAKDFFEVLREYEEYKREPEEDLEKAKKEQKELDFEISPNVLDLKVK